MIPKISIVFLTFNRCEITKKSIIHNLKNSGDQIDEIIWVDNGSTDGVKSFMKSIEPDVSVLNKENLGVSKGYNRGIALSTGDFIIIPGTDTLLCRGWLKKFKENADLNLGYACMTNDAPIENHDNCGPKIISKRAIHKCGYLREDLGLYGGDDVEWGKRVKYYGFIGYRFSAPFKHLGTEGISTWTSKSKEKKEYHDMKFREATNTDKNKVEEACRILKYPKFNPYG